MAVLRKIETNYVTIEELLKRPVSYRVPQYQRDFAWTEDETDVLWQDLVHAYENGEDEYFLGAIVTAMSESEIPSREIVDGQQRLAALSMVLSAISEYWANQSDQGRSDGLFYDFLGSKDRRTGKVLPKLSLNETDDPVFQKFVIQRNVASATDKKLWSSSNKLLVCAFDRFRKALSDWVGEYKEPEEAMLDLEEFVTKKVGIIHIEVEDNADAFVIFETLNDRGLDLAVSDLVKNYLFSKAGRTIERYSKSWRETSLLVGSENMTQFLRHHWLAFHELVREKDLYKSIRSEYANPPATREFIQEIRETADLYAALSNPEHVFWSDHPIEVQEHLEALLRFKAQQFRPVALAAMRKLSPDVTTKILRDLVVVTFRYTVIGSLGTGNLEKAYADAAAAITSGSAKSSKQVFAKLNKIYVDDNQFLTLFESKRMNKPLIARYILARINDTVGTSQEIRVAEDKGRVNLEHILPKKPDGRVWSGSYRNQDELAEVVDLLGNMTLLERGKNRDLGNSSFEVKRSKGFAKSALTLNTELCETLHWDAEAIRSRTKKLAQKACEIWRVGY
ncbi:MAG: DUF262 domain-containing protein [Calditrichaeota bacterium]|nr:DUF262 domain-containing protein [Calditrichota bacterium]MCB9368334.1 DUF262 domain-containing protein [Calditrichota bacterium]